MKLVKVHIFDYRSVHDSTEFEVEPDKTIMVGPNEAGKTALMRALQSVNPPKDEAAGLDPLRDYPRSRYTEITSDKRDAGAVPVAVATFALEPDDMDALHEVDEEVFAGAKTWQLT